MAGSHVPPTESGASGLPWDALLDGRRPPETEDEMKVAQLVAALRAPGTPEELRGADAAVSALLAHRATAVADGAEVVPFVRPGRRRAAVLVAAGLTGTVLFAGTAAAAATGSLPPVVQGWLHAVVGAPAPVEDVATPATTPSRATGEAGPTSRPSAPASSRPTSRPTAPNPVASSHRATPTAPGQTVRPTTPPGQTVRPTVPPAPTQRPTVRPSPTKTKASRTTSHT
jgi:hypothetical protein